MGGYVTLPPTLVADGRAADWVARSLAYVAGAAAQAGQALSARRLGAMGPRGRLHGERVDSGDKDQAGTATSAPSPRSAQRSRGVSSGIRSEARGDGPRRGRARQRGTSSTCAPWSRITSPMPVRSERSRASISRSMPASSSRVVGRSGCGKSTLHEHDHGHRPRDRRAWSPSPGRTWLSCPRAGSRTGAAGPSASSSSSSSCCRR